MTLLDKVKTLCLKSSTTLAQLEKTLNFGNGTLSRWNTSSPSIDKIQKIADYFNVSVDYLLDRDGSYAQGHERQGAQEIIQARDFNAEFEAVAKILGYKVNLKNSDMSSIEFNGKETPLKTDALLSLVDTVKSYIKFTLQEAIKNDEEEYGEDFTKVIVAARGGIYELDKDAAQKLAQSASKAPNRAHDKELF